MNQPLPMLKVNAYTAVAFAGSPARVYFLDHERPASWMKSVAAEVNLRRHTTRGQWTVLSPKHSSQE